MTKVSICWYDFEVKGQGQIYLKYIVCLVIRTSLTIVWLFDRRCSYLAQWLLMVCKLHCRLLTANITLESKIVTMIRNTIITNCRQTHDTARKSHTTITRHQEDKLNKQPALSSPIKMIAKLKWTWSNAQQKLEQLKTPTMAVTINS